MTDTTPSPAPAAGEMAQQPEHNAWVVAVGLMTFRGMCSCGWTGSEFYSQPFAYRQAAQHVTAAAPPPAPEPERAGADALREARICLEAIRSTDSVDTIMYGVRQALAILAREVPRG